MKKNKKIKNFSKLRSQILKFFAIGVLLFGIGGFGDSVGARGSIKSSSYECEAEKGNYCYKKHSRDYDHTTKPCPKGTYQDEEGKKFCKLAPLGTYVSETGATYFTEVSDDKKIGKKIKQDIKINDNIKKLKKFYFNQFLQGDDSGIKNEFNNIGLTSENDVLDKDMECDSSQGYGNNSDGECIPDRTNWKKYIIGGNLDKWKNDDGKFQYLDDNFKLQVVPKGKFLNADKELESCPEGEYQPKQGKNSCIEFNGLTQKGKKINLNKTGLINCTNKPEKSNYINGCKFTCNIGYTGDKCKFDEDNYTIEGDSDTPILKTDSLNNKIKNFELEIKSLSDTIKNYGNIKNFSNYTDKTNFSNIKSEINNYFTDKLSYYKGNLESDLNTKIDNYKKILSEGTGAYLNFLDNKNNINSIISDSDFLKDFDKNNISSITDDMLNFDFSKNEDLLEQNLEKLKSNYNLINLKKTDLLGIKTSISNIYKDFQDKKVEIYKSLKKSFNDNKELYEDNFGIDSIKFGDYSTYDNNSSNDKVIFYNNDYSIKYSNTKGKYLKLINDYFNTDGHENSIKSFTGEKNFSNLVKSYTGKILEIENAKKLFQDKKEEFLNLDFSFLDENGDLIENGIGEDTLEAKNKELLELRDNVPTLIGELNSISNNIEKQYDIFDEFCEDDDLCYGIKLGNNDNNTQSPSLNNRSLNKNEVQKMSGNIKDAEINEEYLRNNKDSLISLLNTTGKYKALIDSDFLKKINKSVSDLITSEGISDSNKELIAAVGNSLVIDENMDSTSSDDDISDDETIKNLLESTDINSDKGIEDSLKSMTDKIVNNVSLDTNSQNSLEGMKKLKDNLNILKFQLSIVKQLELNFENKKVIKGCEPGASIEKDNIKYAGPEGKIPCSISHFKKYTREQKQTILKGLYDLINVYDAKFNDFSTTIIETSDKKNILIDGSGSLICKPGMVSLGNGCADLSKINIKGIAYGSDVGAIITDPFKCSVKTGDKYGPTSKNYSTARECYEGENGFRLINSEGNVKMEGIIYSPEVGALKFGGTDVLTTSMKNVGNNFEYNIPKSINLENQIIADKIYNFFISDDFFKRKGFLRTGTNILTKSDLSDEFTFTSNNGLFDNLYGDSADRIEDIKNKTVDKFNNQLSSLRSEYSNLGFASQVLGSLSNNNLTFNQSNNDLTYYVEELVRRIVGYNQIDNVIDNSLTLSEFKNSAGISAGYPILLSSYVDSNYNNIKDDVKTALENIKNARTGILLGEGTGNGLVATINSQNGSLKSFVSTGSITGNNLKEQILDIKNKINTVKKQLVFLFKEEKNLDGYGDIKGCFDGEYIEKNGIKYAGPDGIVPCSKRVFKSNTEKVKIDNINTLFTLINAYNDKLSTYISNANNNLNGKGNINVTSDGEAEACLNGSANLGKGCTKVGNVNIDGLAYGSDAGAIIMDPFKCSVKTGENYGPISKNYKTAKACYEGENGLRLTITNGRIKLTGIIYSPEVGAIKFGGINDSTDVGFETKDFKVYKSCKDALDRGDSVGDGYYSIDPDGLGIGNNPFTVYCDMTTDGGGWTIVSSMNIEKADLIKKSGGNIVPNNKTNSLETGTLRNWPYYKEFALATKYSNNYNDGSTTNSIWKYDTNGINTRCNLVDYQYNKTDTDGYCSSKDIDFNDCTSSSHYKGYKLFGKHCMISNYRGQSEITYSLTNSRIQRLNSGSSRWINTSSCGASWSRNSCREGKKSNTESSNLDQKAVFMVR